MARYRDGARTAVSSGIPVPICRALHAPRRAPCACFGNIRRSDAAFAVAFAAFAVVTAFDASVAAVFAVVVAALAVVVAEFAVVVAVLAAAVAAFASV